MTARHTSAHSPLSSMPPSQCSIGSIGPHSALPTRTVRERGGLPSSVAHSPPFAPLLGRKQELLESTFMGRLGNYLRMEEEWIFAVFRGAVLRTVDIVRALFAASYLLLNYLCFASVRFETSRFAPKCSKASTWLSRTTQRAVCAPQHAPKSQLIRRPS